jgi:hypothetical protein
VAVQAWGCAKGPGMVVVGKKCIGRTWVDAEGAATAVDVVDVDSAAGVDENSLVVVVENAEARMG